MPSNLSLFSFAASLLLLSRPAYTQQSRITPDNSTAVPLQPVLPPSGDADDFAILSPSPSQTLFWGGASNSAIDKRSDGNNAILVNAAFDFLFPSVALDHSSSIAHVSCSNGNTMTGTFSSVSAYAFVKEVWSNLTEHVLFITSADGCGEDNENGVFLAQAIFFSNDALSFTAVGTEHSVQNVASQATITWGNTNPGELRKRQYSDLVKRPAPASDGHYSNSLGFGLDYMLVHDPHWPVDADASWSNAVRFSSGDGWVVDCADCGIQADFQVTGTFTLDFVQGQVTFAQVSLSGNLYASLFLGINTAGPVQNTLTQQVFSSVFGSFYIGSLFTVAGVSANVNAQATLDIRNAGQLLVGASARQQGLQATVDLLNPGSSYGHAYPPTLQARVEVGTSMDANVVLSLPIGIGFNVYSEYLSNMNVQLTTTPSVTAVINSGGGDCSQGNEYTLDFDNKVDVNVVGDDDYLIARYSDQVAEGCLPVTQNPTTTDPTTPNPPATGLTCVNGIPSGTPPDGTFCGLKGYYLPSFHPPRIGKPLRGVATALECAEQCDQTSGCLSVMYNAGKKNCFLYSAGMADIPIKTVKSPSAVHVWWDIACWEPCFTQVAPTSAIS